MKYLNWLGLLSVKFDLMLKNSPKSSEKIASPFTNKEHKKIAKALNVPKAEVWVSLDLLNVPKAEVWVSLDLLYFKLHQGLVSEKVLEDCELAVTWLNPQRKYLVGFEERQSQHTNPRTLLN